MDKTFARSRSPTEISHFTNELHLSRVENDFSTRRLFSRENVDETQRTPERPTASRKRDSAYRPGPK